MKKIILWTIALPFIFLLFYVVLRIVFCRPNPFTVHTATPVVKKIATYIEENGLPNKLDEIPDLPYKLEECTRKEVYWNGHSIAKDKKEADWMELLYDCKFFKNGKAYQIYGRFMRNIDKYDWEGDMDIDSGKTTVGVSFETSNNKLVPGSIGTGYSKLTGLCKQFKQ